MDRTPSLWPPRALLIALFAQIPLVVVLWPPSFHVGVVVAGGLTFAIGAALNLAADAQMRGAKVEVRPFHDTPNLVLGGPYRFTRNPMYLGMTLIAAAPAVIFGLWLNLVAAAAFALWAHWTYVVPEERFLKERFGEAFESYRSRSPRWIGLPSLTRKT